MIFLRRKFIFSLVLLSFFMVGRAEAGRNEALIVNGVAKTISSAFAIPFGILGGAAQNGFPFGLVTGAVQGTFSAVGKAVSGAADIARGGAPYAKYAALAL